MSDEVFTDTGPFAIVPLWLVKAVSPNALSVYALLAAKWANRETNDCYPSRKVIAKEWGKSTDTVDRAIKELEGAGAIEVTRRKTEDGDYTSNSYRIFTVQRVAAERRVPPPRDSAATGPRDSAATGPRQDAELTRISLNQNQLEPFVASSSSPLSSITTDGSTIIQPPSAAPLSHPSHTTTDMSEAAAITPGPDGDSTVRPGSTGRPALGEQVRQVYEAWVEIMGKNAGAKLNDKRRSKIEARLREQYSVEELIAAIHGARANPWMMGDNDRGTPYNDIVTILRDGATVEKHRDYVPQDGHKKVAPMDQLRELERKLQEAS